MLFKNGSKDEHFKWREKLVKKIKTSKIYEDENGFLGQIPCMKDLRPSVN